MPLYSTFFTLEQSNMDSVKWDFGDPISGIQNNSNAIKNIFHYYSKIGSYKVQLISFYKTRIDTTVRIIYIGNYKPLRLCYIIIYDCITFEIVRIKNIHVTSGEISRNINIIRMLIFIYFY